MLEDACLKGDFRMVDRLISFGADEGKLSMKGEEQLELIKMRSLRSFKSLRSKLSWGNKKGRVS